MIFALMVGRKRSTKGDNNDEQTDAKTTEPVIASRARGTFRRRAAASTVLIALPVLAATVYLKLGSPELPGQPLASRAAAPAQDPTLDALVARVEAHLAQNPDDGRGWEVVAPA